MPNVASQNVNIGAKLGAQVYMRWSKVFLSGGILGSLATCSCVSIEIAFRRCSNMADNRNNTTNYPGYFLTNRNGTLLTPFHQNVYLGSFQFTTAVIGIPLNLILASAVLRSPELRSEPRNILLGVIFSSLSAFAISFMDVTYAVLLL